MSIFPAPQEAILALGLLLAFKHFWGDGPFQTLYMVQNKGKFLHIGGIAHALIHGGLTVLVLVAWSLIWQHNDLTPVKVILLLGVFDFVAHYCIDFTKEYFTKGREWVIFEKDNAGNDYQKIVNSKFYQAIIADQCAHFACYVLILSIVA